MNKLRKLPLRQCIVCRTQQPKKNLLRVVRTADGTLCLDSHGKAPGRGAYLCRNRDCIARAVRNDLLKRHLDLSPTPELVTQLQQQVSDELGES